MRDADPKWNAVSRATVSQSIIPKMVTETENKIKDELTNPEITHVSTTVDIWSDRLMRGYMGITCHVMVETSRAIELKSRLLSCSRYVMIRMLVTISIHID